MLHEKHPIEETIEARELRMKKETLNELWQKFSSALQSFASKSMTRDQQGLLIRQLTDAAAEDRLELLQVNVGPQIADRCQPLIQQIEALERSIYMR